MEEEKENLKNIYNNNSCKGFLTILNEFIIKNYKKFYITMGNGKNKKKIEKRLYSIFTKAFVFIAIIFLIEILFVLGFLIFEKEHNPQSILDLLGPFGDFFGGMLNPILTFCTFMALLMTIILQQRELKLSREQVAISVKELGETRKATEISSLALTEQSESLKIQNFENTFFNMINLHNEIIANIKLENNLIFSYSNYYSNLDYKKSFLIENYLIREPKSIYGREAISYIITIIDDFSYKGNYNAARLFNNVYDLCHDAMQIHLGHYFGNIYQILKFIYLNKDLTKKEKEKYSDLYRAQFSSIELKLLFYHCVGKIGIRKFKKYIEKFKFFEHLVIEEDNYIFEFILCRSFYNHSAFNNNKNIVEYINKTKLPRETDQYTSKATKIHNLYLLDNDSYALDILKEYSTSSSHEELKMFQICIKELEDEIKKKSISSSQEPQ